MANTDSRAYNAYELSRWVARLGWLILVVALLCPAWRPHALPAAQFVFPRLLCLMYLWMVWEGRSGFKSHGLKTFSTSTILASSTPTSARSTPAGSISSLWTCSPADGWFATGSRWACRSGLSSSACRSP